MRVEAVGEEGGATESKRSGGGRVVNERESDREGEW